MNRRCFIKLISSLLFLGTVFLGSCTTSQKKGEVNLSEWKSIQNERYKMAGNIVKTKFLVGKTKEEVAELLGNADFVFDDENIRYYLGFNQDSKNVFYVYKIISFGEDVLDILFGNNMVVEVIINRRYYYPQKVFNQHDWEKYADSRFTMSSFIIKRRILMGKTKDEVFNILGSQECIVGQNMIEYNIGFIPGPFNIDPEVLQIIFENEKVIKVTQRET